MRHSILKINKVEIIENRKGFTLVELSIVLVIIGIILGGATVLFQSSVSTARLSTTRKSLDIIKESVINYAITNNRLPCPDSNTPPANDGITNPISTTCTAASPFSCNCGGATFCANPPCWVPFTDLQLQLPQGRDSFNNVFRYDVSFEPTSGRGLTNTNSDTFCPLLLQYMIQSTTVGVLNQPCVTNAGADDGRINAAGQGYGVAAVIISETAEGGVFNAPRNVANEGLDAKNVRAANREYEMANRQNDTAYGNLVAELTYGDLYSKVCGGLQQRPKITIQNNTGGVRYARLQSTSVVCVAVNNGLPFDLYRNNDVQFYTNATCTAACGGIITYINSYAADNAGNGNGIAQISGACAMTDI